MKNITLTMINEYGLKKHKCDFMGYKLEKGDTYSFHHLIIPKSICKELKISNNGICKDNGAILCSNTSHPYLHIIENYEYEMFLAITSEMIDMNIKGQLDIRNLVNIHTILEEFEAKYRGEKSKKGHLIVLPKFEKRLILKKE